MTFTRRDLVNAVSGWGHSDWSKNIDALRSTVNVGLSTDAIAYLVDSLTVEIDRGRFGRAMNWALLSLALGDDEILCEARWQDCFRPTRVSPQRLPGLVNMLGSLRTRVATRFSSSVSERISTWAYYAELYAKTREDERRLLRELRQRDSHSVHSLLILAERVFFQHTLPPERLEAEIQVHRHPGKLGFDDLSPEELASAASYAIEAYSRRYGLSLMNFGRFGPNRPTPDSFKPLMVMAARLSHLLDLEASVFRLGYRCSAVARRQYLIEPPDDLFGMALAFGYIKEAWVPFRFRRDANGAERFSSLCEKWHEHFGAKTVRFVQNQGHSRVRVELPEPIAQKLGEEFLMSDALFYEEIIELKVACYQWMVSFESVLAMTVRGALTIRDVLKITRIFRFMSYLRALQLQRSPSDSYEVWNSIVAGLDQDALIEMLQSFGVSEATAKEYLDIASWDPQQQRFLDLQYTPLLRLGTYIAVPGSILSGSNAMRSTLVTTKRRFHATGEGDPLPSMICEAFKTVTSEVRSNLAYDFEGERGDLDCVAQFGGTVYVCECKNTILPCSAFEQRTLFDHVQKAAKQLSRVVTLWSRSEFRKYIASRLGAACENAEIRTCIVLSPRLLSGASVHGHAIRQANELANFIANGTALVEVGGVRHEVKLWAGQDLTKEELDDYLADDGGRVYRSIWQAFRPEDVPWAFEGASVLIRLYGFDAVRHLHALGHSDLAELVRNAAAVADRETGSDECNAGGPIGENGP